MKADKLLHKILYAYFWKKYKTYKLHTNNNENCIYNRKSFNWGFFIICLSEYPFDESY